MDFERLIKRIVEKTSCSSEFTGDENNPEYKLIFPMKEDRKQEIILFPFEEEEKSYIRMYSPIGNKSDFSQAKLISFLELNMSFRIGSFALFQGEVVLQNATMYSSVVDEDRVIDDIKYLIKLADAFEDTLIGLDRK